MEACQQQDPETHDMTSTVITSPDTVVTDATVVQDTLSKEITFRD